MATRKRQPKKIPWHSAQTFSSKKSDQSQDLDLIWAADTLYLKRQLKACERKISGKSNRRHMIKQTCHKLTTYISLNRPTGPIHSSSRNVRPLLLFPFYMHLPGEQRRSQGSKAISHCGIHNLKKMYHHCEWQSDKIFSGLSLAGEHWIFLSI